ncbi:RNA polymerase sigma factor [Phenylobacterium sp. LjRoot164]|uniref:RNA polymerase sigma factor n=1 Tax=unclassified Phenylobacterium TaxID=2640670 RepID=UPI003ECE1848
MSVLDRAEPIDLRASSLDGRYRRCLMTYFLNRVRHRADAEDLTQQTFLRVLAADRSEVFHPKAFVFRVAANLLTDRARDQIRRNTGRTWSLDDETVIAVPSDNVTPERILLARDDVDRALEALAELKPTTCEVFVLFRLECLPQREIARRLGLTRAAVEKHVMRASAHLVRRIEGTADGQVGAKLGRR